MRIYIPDSKTWLAFACWLKSLGIRQRITLKYFVFQYHIEGPIVLPTAAATAIILVLMHVSTSMSNVCSCVANFVSFYWLFTFSHWNRVMSSHFVHANIVQMLLYYGCYWWISCECIYIYRWYQANHHDGGGGEMTFGLVRSGFSPEEAFYMGLESTSCEFRE